MKYHIPVLLNSSVDGLHIKENGVYADLTFGGGGHSRKILSEMKEGKLMVFDQDKDAFNNLPEDKRLITVHSNFRYLENFVRYHDLGALDGILADLGISSWQIDQKERGFSFRFDAELDMRMNSGAYLKASDVINEYNQKELLRIFRDYGEIKNAGRVVKAIESERRKRKIINTGDLTDILKPMTKRNQENKFYSKVFQALRIEVNQELDALKEMLLQTERCLKPGGRLVVLSYHSLEDRLVKNFMKTGNLSGKQEKDFYGNVISPFRMITKKPEMADFKEIEENSRARSVRLRIAELKQDE